MGLLRFLIGGLGFKSAAWVSDWWLGFADWWTGLMICVCGSVDGLCLCMWLCCWFVFVCVALLLV